MSKRIADNYLTDQNWDQDDKVEEAGEFKLADETKLKSRKIVKAVRRTNTTSDSGSEGTGLFKNFTGFAPNTNKVSSATAVPTFNFGNSTSKSLGGLSDTTKSSETAPKLLNFNSSKSLENSTSSSNSETNSLKGLDKNVPNGSKTDDIEKARSRYSQQLCRLNESVSQWIKQNVEKHPDCILTPIFKDYEKYLAKIEENNPDKDDNDAVSKTTAFSQSSSSFESTTKVKPFTFGDKSLTSISESTSTSESKPTTSFKWGSSTGAVSAFGGASGSGSSALKPFTFGASVQHAAAKSEDTASKGEDEEYVPPKPEVVEVKEDDAFYTKRCKLFYQKEGAWVEKGIGNLHLKKLDGKTQLVMRADTNLGNILLNIMLHSSIPMKRQGKNNVTMICIPNPPIDPKIKGDVPVSMLFRVKTGDDADEMLKQFQDNK